MHVTPVRTRVAVLAGAALLTLTGCLQADLGVTLNDDESGQFRARTVINREQFSELENMFGGMMEEGSTAPTDPCTELMEDDFADDELPEGAVVEPIDDGEWCGALVTVPFDDLAEFAEIADEFNESSSDSEAGGFGAMTITKTDGGYRFDVAGIEMSDEAMSAGGEEMGELGPMLEQFLGSMRISYDVQLPGRPVDHNADAVEGNRFQWNLQWGDSRTELFAETGAGEPDGSSDTGDITDNGASGGGSESPAAPGASGDADDDDGGSLLWLWILLGIVAVGVIGFIVVKQTKRSKPGDPETQLPPPGQPSPGWTPPPPPPPAG